MLCRRHFIPQSIFDYKKARAACHIVTDSPAFGFYGYFRQRRLCILQNGFYLFQIHVCGSRYLLRGKAVFVHVAD